MDDCRAILSRLDSVKKFGARNPNTATINTRIGKIPTVCSKSLKNAFFSEADFATCCGVPELVMVNLFFMVLGHASCQRHNIFLRDIRVM